MDSTRAYITVPTSSLIEWDKVKTIIIQKDFDLLKDKLQKKRQFRPLFVTPSDDGNSYIVLAGRKRTRAYKELEVPLVWVTVLQFFQKDNGLWYVFKDGVEEMEAFESKDDAMLDWALTDNEDFGKVDIEEFAKNREGFNLDWSQYMMRTDAPHSVAGGLKKYLIGEVDKSKKEKHTCPDCGANHTVKI